METTYNADLPTQSVPRSGSSCVFGLLSAINALNGKTTIRKLLAREAIRLEQNVMKESVGCQDQIWASYGGLNQIDFNTDGSFVVSPLILDQKRRAGFHSSLMLFFTGFSRYASEIAATLIIKIEQKEDHIH